MPLEFVIPQKSYSKLNRWLMSSLFCVPLWVSLKDYVEGSSSSSFPDSCAIALFETHFDRTRAHDFAALTEEPDDFDERAEDPEPFHSSDDMGEGDDEGMKISKVSFEELKKSLPSLTRSVQAEILHEVSCAGRPVRYTADPSPHSQIKQLKQRLDKMEDGKGKKNGANGSKE